MWNNCFFYAHVRHCRMLRAWRKKGSPQDCVPAIVRRPSRLAPSWVGHWFVGFWCPETSTFKEIESFCPVDKSPLPWWRLWRAAVFRGYVKRGDKTDKQ